MDALDTQHSSPLKSVAETYAHLYESEDGLDALVAMLSDHADPSNQLVAMQTLSAIGPGMLHYAPFLVGNIFQKMMRGSTRATIMDQLNRYAQALANPMKKMFLDISDRMMELPSAFNFIFPSTARPPDQHHHIKFNSPVWMVGNS